MDHNMSFFDDSNIHDDRSNEINWDNSIEDMIPIDNTKTLPEEIVSFDDNLRDVVTINVNIEPTSADHELGVDHSQSDSTLVDTSANQSDNLDNNLMSGDATFNQSDASNTSNQEMPQSSGLKESDSIAITELGGCRRIETKPENPERLYWNDIIKNEEEVSHNLESMG